MWQKISLTDLTSETYVNIQWAQCKEAVGETEKDVIGYVTKERKNYWFNEECKVVTKTKNDARMNMLREYGSINKVRKFYQTINSK